MPAGALRTGVGMVRGLQTRQSRGGRGGGQVAGALGGCCDWGSGSASRQWGEEGRSQGLGALPAQDWPGSGWGWRGVKGSGRVGAAPEGCWDRATQHV